MRVAHADMRRSVRGPKHELSVGHRRASPDGEHAHCTWGIASGTRRADELGKPETVYKFFGGGKTVFSLTNNLHERTDEETTGKTRRQRREG